MTWFRAAALTVAAVYLAQLAPFAAAALLITLAVLAVVALLAGFNAYGFSLLLRT